MLLEHCEITSLNPIYGIMGAIRNWLAHQRDSRTTEGLIWPDGLWILSTCDSGYAIWRRTGDTMGEKQRNLAPALYGPLSISGKKMKMQASLNFFSFSMSPQNQIHCFTSQQCHFPHCVSQTTGESWYAVDCDLIITVALQNITGNHKNGPRPDYTVFAIWYVGFC